MITKLEILTDIQAVFLEHFRFEAEQVQPETHLYTDLGLDSLDAIDLVIQLETKTGIKLEESEMKALRTINDVMEAIYKHHGAEGKA